MKGLLYFWRSHLAVTLGAAVACAVLTGALIVGDSVRGSLRDLVLDRLGAVDHAVVAEGFVREELARSVELASAGALRARSLISVRGSVLSGSSGRQRRASNVQVFGVGAGFLDLFPGSNGFVFERTARQIAPSAVVNASLAAELDLEAGDQIVVAVERPAEAPRETLVGRKDAEDTIERLRLTVTSIVPDGGAGGFRFSPQQTAPRNLFVELDRLQRALFGRSQTGRVNALLVDVTRDEPLAASELHGLLAETTTLDDLSLTSTRTENGVRIGSRQFVLPDAVTQSVLAFARERKLGARPTLTYLANSLDSDRGSLPYSTITAIDTEPDARLEPLVLVDGGPAPALADDEILIDSWAAEDLGDQMGEEIRVRFFRLGARDELFEDSLTLRLAGVTRLSGPAVDPGLTPEFPGMQDAEDIAAWDPPFPVELGRVRDRDETYWDLYAAAPKAFVSLATGRRLWSSRFGNSTSIELVGPPGTSPFDLTEILGETLPRQLVESRGGGLTVLSLREDGLAAARGATDFGGLFLGLSFFLIGSAALLVALLFRLGVEQRAKEVGLLRAVGFPEARVRRRFLREGIALAAVGSLAGVAAAAGYAAAMLAALKTWWLTAVGTTALELHLAPVSLATGWVASVLTVAVTLWLALRQLRLVPAPTLLAGSVRSERKRPPRIRSRTVAISAGIASIALLAVAPLLGPTAMALVAMSIGLFLLVGGIAWLAHRLGTARRSPNRLTGTFGRSPVIAMGSRNGARNAGRSLASVALIASAVFLLVVVGANRRTGTIDVDDRASGAGGFRLLATTDVPILVDLNDAARRSELGFSGDDSNALARSLIMGLRRLPGEDASCLNLYRPGKPSVLGVPAEMIERGGFAFQSASEAIENPWELLDRELEPGVIPAIADYNSAMWILHLGLGDDLVLEDQNGKPVRLRLVGLLKKSIFQSEILVSEAEFIEHFPRQSGYSFFLVQTPADDRLESEMTEILETDLDRFGLDVISSRERITNFQAVENTYIATFQTLGGLGLLLGTIGMGVVLLRNVLERRGELATLRAFGFRKGLLARMVLAENAVLLVAGIAIGTIAGLAAVVPNLISEGHHLPAGALALTLLLVLVVGMLASSFAVAGTVRAPLLAALKGD